MSTKRKIVHDAATDPDGLTPCCARDPRELGRTDAFDLDHGKVTCTGLDSPPADDPKAAAKP